MCLVWSGLVWSGGGGGGGGNSGMSLGRLSLAGFQSLMYVCSKHVMSSGSVLSLHH